MKSVEESSWGHAVFLSVSLVLWLGQGPGLIYIGFHVGSEIYHPVALAKSVVTSGNCGGEGQWQPGNLSIKNGWCHGGSLTNQANPRVALDTIQSSIGPLALPPS